MILSVHKGYKIYGLLRLPTQVNICAFKYKHLYGTLSAPIFCSGGSIKIDAGAEYSKVAIWDKHENKSIKKNTPFNAKLKLFWCK